LWYTGREYENYLGLSAALSLREDLDPGVGVLVHFRRNLNLGITWHDVDEDPYLFFSLDLFRLVSSNSKKYIDRYEQLRNRL
jgi:hypothetical protein